MEPARVELLVKCGNQTSLRELYEHFYSRIFATVMALVRNREWAEDITQESFYRAFRKLKGLREPAKFAPWLAAIATNLALDSLKKEKKHVSTADIFADGHDHTSASSSVEDQVLQNEKVELVRAALRILPPEQYQAIILYYYHHQKIEDIAAFLGVRTGTIKSRMHRARQKLFKILKNGEQNDSMESLLSKEQDQDVEAN